MPEKDLIARYKTIGTSRFQLTANRRGIIPRQHTGLNPIVDTACAEISALNLEIEIAEQILIGILEPPPFTDCRFLTAHRGQLYPPAIPSRRWRWLYRWRHAADTCCLLLWLLLWSSLLGRYCRNRNRCPLVYDRTANNTGRHRCRCASRSWQIIDFIQAMCCLWYRLLLRHTGNLTAAGWPDRTLRWQRYQTRGILLCGRTLRRCLLNGWLLWLIRTARDRWQTVRRADFNGAVG